MTQWNEEYLNDLLSTPSQALIDLFRNMKGHIGILGAGGKMGETISLMAARAIKEADSSLKLTAVSRFSDKEKQAYLESQGVPTIASDLSSRDDLARLPDFTHIVYMVGRKFGTDGAEYRTWHSNVTVPYLVAERFNNAVFSAFSTGNVYPFVHAQSGGCSEAVPAEPIGEYAMSSLGRERIFENATHLSSIQVTILRLNYACDLRYGVLHDVAHQVWDGKAVDLSVPNFNCIWQGYVADVSLRSLEKHDKAFDILNLSGPEINSTREVALRFGKLFDKEVNFTEEGSVSLLNNAGKCMEKYGFPQYGVNQLIQWQAEWILAGGRNINAPTHFEMNKGKF
jgi:nucleoside-diphosphate-sugar epimerase